MSSPVCLEHEKPRINKNGVYAVEIRENQKKKVSFPYFLTQPCRCETERQYVCPRCFDVLDYPNFARRHYNSHHKNRRGLYDCKHCPNPEATNMTLMEAYYHDLTHCDVTHHLNQTILNTVAPGIPVGHLLSYLEPPQSYQMMELDTSAPFVPDDGPDANGNENEGLPASIQQPAPIPTSSSSSGTELATTSNPDQFPPEIPPTSDPQELREMEQDYAMEGELLHSSGNPITFASLQSIPAVSNPAILRPIPEIYEKWMTNPYFPNEKFLRFSLRYPLKLGCSVATTEAILKDIRDEEEFNSPIAVSCQYPRNYAEIASCLSKLPIFPLSDLFVSVPEQLQRNLSMNPNLVANMVFTPETPENGVMREFCHTPRFRELCSKLKEGEVGLMLLLYQDKFKKCRSVFGSTCGIYYDILNLPKLENAKLRNIFTIGLGPTDFDVHQIMTKISKQLKEHPVIDIRLPDGKWVKARIFISLDTCDMPQRHANCYMMLYNSNSIPCFRCHCSHDSDDLVGDDVFPERNMAVWKAKLLEYISLSANSRENHERLNELYAEGVRLWVKGPNGKDALMSSIPFYEIEHYDPIKHTAVDLYHVEFLGLIPLHFSCFADRVVSETDKPLFEKLFKDEQIDISARNYWNGDQWLDFCMKSSFILHKFCNSNPIFQVHLENWLKHVSYVVLLLAEGMSNSDVDAVLTKCKVWRREFVAIYGKEAAAVPNFHAVLHCISDIKLYGPPIIWWTRHFEHKHKYFRGIIDHSNHKFIELFTLRRDEYMNLLRLMFPFASVDFSIRSGSYANLAKSDFVQVFKQGEERLAQVLGVDVATATLKLFKKQYVFHPWIPKAISTNDLVEESIVTLSYSRIKKRHMVTNGYINPFSCLNFCRYKIPDRILSSQAL